ncbi:MAG: NAD(P)/FAD-dependent oxidoreductase, partial [Myxococcales bacterium]|nr:NAD(P)/FAD-dependent oxidoreductase [Myxococcales bacterium]
MNDTVKGRAKHPWDKRGKGETRYDDIVIGSGMGGMTCAALLATLGRKVLVLEQHYVPGGFTHTFHRPGYTWDVGVHAIGEVTHHSLTGRLLSTLSRGELEWASLGSVYDTFLFPGDFHIDFPDSPHAFRDNLAAAFPSDTRAIDGYLDRVKDVAAAMKSYYLARTLPAGPGAVVEAVLARRARKVLDERTSDALAKLTPNPRLRTVLASQWGYYGSIPKRSSFAMQALVTKHFMHGGYYPVGGSARIAETLLRTVANAGGWTRISSPVDQILLERGRAVGVRLESGEEIRAERVISAAGVASTVTRLLPAEVGARRWVGDVARLEPGPAHVCLYLGFKGDIRKAGATAANQWFYHTWSTEGDAAAWDVSDPENLDDAPVLYVSFPSLKDPEHVPGPEERHTGEVVTFVPWESFASWQGSRWKKRGADYEAFKAAIKEKLLNQLLAHRPDLGPMIDHVELSTPLSTDHFTRPMAGSIYGLEPTPERFRCRWLRPKSPIPGLWFAGSEVVSV